ncbi:BSD domain protein [Aspergillus affinis]|uniref:BSD domain protein n=1 Tax=Aspergillus affinis TaxID=1070780 RepID=UPI0022FF2005|nr:BSD domain protein [Aspergillus affinis]KAI9046359.1 BSD domain protein [Aspergillus affinis]
MRRGDRTGTTSRPNPERFRTPDKPATGRSSTVSDRSKRTSLLSRGSSHGTPASSNSTFRSSRRDTGPSEQGQPTLTQIDFVTPVSQNVPSSDDLDYIGDHGQQNYARKTSEVIELDDDSEDDTEYRPSNSNSEKRRSRGVRFDTDTGSNKKRRKSDSTNQSGRNAERNRRKSDDSVKGKKKGKQPQSKEQHKTLTQMDYVRRYLKIEPDDEVKLEYTYQTPKKQNEQKPDRKPTPAAEDARLGPNLGQGYSSELKRRKPNRPELNKISEPVAYRKDGKSLKQPVTPQKPRRSEIPSSQSPESPGLAIISSSQFRSATRSPLKRPPLLAADMPIKKESPKHEHSGEGDILNANQDASPFRDTSPPMMLDSPLSQKHAVPENPIVNVFDTQPNPSSEQPLERGDLEPDEANKPPSTTQRTVVYETDAESDYGDSQDNLSSPLGSPTKRQSVDLGHDESKEDDDLENDDSQYLPPPPVPPFGQETDSGLLNSENLTSDASVYYKRVQPATQFPLEPIPTLNTQKLAELFPNESSQLRTPVKKPRLLSDPNNCIPSTQTQTPTQTQTQTQSQTQSQDADKTPTEIVPESSPIARQEDGSAPNRETRFKPRLQDAVVQVESSQPADKLPRGEGRKQDSYQGGILSEGQILTSSVMESVSMPAYDHIQEEIFTSNDASKKEDAKDQSTPADRPNVDLNTELQETFRAFSASPWGARIGGLWDNVRKQGESYYEGARQEYAAASEEAVKGFSDLRETIVGRTRGLSLSTPFAAPGSTEKTSDEAPTPTASRAGEGPAAEGGETSEKSVDGAGANANANAGEGFLSRFKAEAGRRLKELEKAEEAADEAILRFGQNIGQKLRDAVSIVPPGTDSNKILFESKDSEGKRVIHATRFEAQLHVIHSNLDSFTKDPVSDEWPTFQKEFNVDTKTSAIAADLEKYPELRAAMEKVVPEQVEYATFWCRYYFLRLVIETEEQKRKELLKGANVNEEEEVAWDDDSDDETDSPATPQGKPNKPTEAQSSAPTTEKNNLLKPNEPRRSNDQQSQADSESSYDVVSGATSRTPASPKDKNKDDDSDEDWE